MLALVAFSHDPDQGVTWRGRPSQPGVGAPPTTLSGRLTLITTVNTALGLPLSLSLTIKSLSEWMEGGERLWGLLLSKVLRHFRSYILVWGSLQSQIPGNLLGMWYNIYI